MFGLSRFDAEQELVGMLAVLEGWREFFASKGVEARSIAMLEQAILPPSFYRDEPLQSV